MIVLTCRGCCGRSGAGQTYYCYYYYYCHIINIIIRTDQASLWKQTTTEVAGSCCTALYRSGALHHSSRGSGSVRCTEIMSDTYWNIFGIHIKYFYSKKGSKYFFRTDRISVVNQALSLRLQLSKLNRDGIRKRVKLNFSIVRLQARWDSVLDNSSDSC